MKHSNPAQDNVISSHILHVTQSIEHKSLHMIIVPSIMLKMLMSTSSVYWLDCPHTHKILCVVVKSSGTTVE